MRPLVTLVALTSSRVAALTRGNGTPEEFRESMAYVVAAADKAPELPPDPLGDRRPHVHTPKMRPVQNG